MLYKIARPTILRGILWTAAAFAIQISPAEAQQTGFSHERASIAFGAFITDRRTETRLDTDFGPGSDIQLENDLGLESSTTVFRLGGNVWIKPRQRFDFSIFDLSRSATRQIDETIVFGDETFDINTEVTTNADLTIGKVDYSYAIVAKPRGYLGITGGLYIGRTKLALSEPTLGSAKTEDLTAPLPVAGFRGEFAITDRIVLSGVSQWFSIDAGDASGHLRDVYLAADYRFGNRFSLGLAYNDVTMNIKAEEAGGWTGRLDWGYDGWLVYLKTEFGN